MPYGQRHVVTAMYITMNDTIEDGACRDPPMHGGRNSLTPSAGINSGAVLTAGG